MSGGMGGGEGGVDVEMLTTKGDTHGFDTDNARVPIGANTQVLTADSTEALGLKWATPSGAPTTTKGDISGFSTTQSRVPIGANTQVLTADSTEALGLKWAAAAAGGKLKLIEAVELSSANNKIITTVSVNTALYSKILIQWETGQSATTSTAIGFRVNNNAGATQLVQGYEQAGATQTTFGTTTNYMELNPHIGWSTNEVLQGQMSIFCPTGTSSGAKRFYFGGFCQTYFEATGKNRVFGMVNSHNNTSTHATYEIFCVNAALTFKAGTNMTVYGVEKA